MAVFVFKPTQQNELCIDSVRAAIKNAGEHLPGNLGTGDIRADEQRAMQFALAVGFEVAEEMDKPHRRGTDWPDVYLPFGRGAVSGHQIKLTFTGTTEGWIAAVCKSLERANNIPRCPRTSAIRWCLSVADYWIYMMQDPEINDALKAKCAVALLVCSERGSLIRPHDVTGVPWPKR